MCGISSLPNVATRKGAGISGTENGDKMTQLITCQDCMLLCEAFVLSALVDKLQILLGKPPLLFKENTDLNPYKND